MWSQLSKAGRGQRPSLEEPRRVPRQLPQMPGSAGAVARRNHTRLANAARPGERRSTWCRYLVHAHGQAFLTLCGHLDLPCRSPRGPPGSSCCGGGRGGAGLSPGLGPNPLLQLRPLTSPGASPGPPGRTCRSPRAGPTGPRSPRARARDRRPSLQVSAACSLPCQGSTHRTVVVETAAQRVGLRRGGPRGGGPSQSLMLGHGDLVVMGGSCQRTWEHAVPKTARPVGPRVSVQFRPAGVA